MRTTIDAAGRVVIPKSLRDAMGLAAGQEIDVTYVDGRIEIDVPWSDVRVEMRDGFPVAVSERSMPPLTTEMVRDTLEQIRR